MATPIHALECWRVALLFSRFISATMSWAEMNDGVCGFGSSVCGVLIGSTDCSTLIGSASGSATGSTLIGSTGCSTLAGSASGSTLIGSESVEGTVIEIVSG